MISFCWMLLEIEDRIMWGVTVHIVVLYILSSATICTDPHCTYCRPSAHIVADKKVIHVHIVVGDNMCLTSLHILSPHRCCCLRIFFYSFVNVIGVFITKTCLVGYFMQRDSDGTYCRHVHIVATDNVSYPYISCCRPAVCIVDGCNIIRVDIYCRWRI